MRKCFWVFLLLLLSCGQKRRENIDKQVVDNYLPKYSKEEIVHKLNNITLISNQKNREDSLTDFFDNWNKDIPANSPNFINQNDTIREVFSIFKTIYNPFDLLKIGNWEGGIKLNSKCKYVAIQNSIYYSVLRSDISKRSTANNSRLLVTNFRPVVNIDDTRIVYLTKEYKGAIDNCLGTEESVKRHRMLWPFIPIRRGHSVGWNIETSPNVECITLNKSLNTAYVEYSVGYEGGEATLVKSNGDWVIKESHTTWIQ
jgi:hypothetical protein